MINRVYIIPHGDELLYYTGPESRKMADAIRKGTSHDDSDVHVILTPHGLSINDRFSVTFNDRYHGSYRIGNNTVSMDIANDVSIARAIFNENRDVVSSASFSAGGENSVFPIDFGSMIPLKFFNASRVVVIGQSRIWELQKLHSLGESLFKVLSGSKEKISLIFSCDQAHTHNPEGPYGYSEEAKAYDKIVVDAINSNNFGQVVRFSRDFVEKAKPDSFWNLNVAIGFLKASGMKFSVGYYYVERYFGMLFATAD